MMSLLLKMGIVLCKFLDKNFTAQRGNKSLISVLCLIDGVIVGRCLGSYTGIIAF